MDTHVNGYAREWIRTWTVCKYVCINYLVNTQEILHLMPRSHETGVIVQWRFENCCPDVHMHVDGGIHLNGYACECTTHVWMSEIKISKSLVTRVWWRKTAVMLHNAKYAMSIFSQLGHVHLKMSKRCVKLFSLIFIIRCLTKCNLIQLLPSSSSTSSSPLFLLSLSLSSLLLSLLLSLWSGQIFFSDLLPKRAGHSPWPKVP